MTNSGQSGNFHSLIAVWCIIISAFYLSACNCKDDVFGSHLQLIVPFESFPKKDTFNVGDTIHFNFDFSKEVSVLNKPGKIRLDSFNFFTDFFIAEISGEEENYWIPIDTIVDIARMAYLPLVTAVIYPVYFLENADSYQFSAKIVLKQSGLYWMGFSTDSFLYESYEHPSMYACKNERRYKVEVFYTNPSTSVENYNTMFLSTKVQYLPELTDYEEYSGVGAISIYVK